MCRFPKRTLAALLGVAMLAAACGGDDDEGGSGSEPITIGAVFDLSGPTSDVGVPYAEGIRDYVEYLNGQGGLEGRQVNLLSQDYAYQVPQAESLYTQFAGQGAVAIIGWGTADTEALRGRVNADEKPFISASYSANLADPAETPYNFFPGASYSDQMRVALKWIADQGDDGAEVAVFHHDSPFGKSPLEDGQSYIEDNELGLGYETYAMAAGATDYIGELSRAKQQGADYVVVQNVPSPAAILLQNIASQELDMQVICLNYCGDELLVRLAGDAAEGVMGVMPFAPPGTVEDLGEISEFLESKGQALDDHFPPLRYVQGWHTARVFLEGIGRAAAENETLEGPAMKEALETIEDYETGVGPAITFTSENHAGMKGAPLYKAEGGAWTKVTDVLTP